jgi:hypothetical protein
MTPFEKQENPLENRLRVTYQNLSLIATCPELEAEGLALVLFKTDKEARTAIREFQRHVPLAIRVVHPDDFHGFHGFLIPTAFRTPDSTENKTPWDVIYLKKEMLLARKQSVRAQSMAELCDTLDVLLPQIKENSTSIHYGHTAN